MPSTIYKFELQIDATQAEQAAREFRDLMERELGQIQSRTQPGGPAATPAATIAPALKEAGQAADELRAKFERMSVQDLRSSMAQAVKDARELRSVLEGIKLPDTQSAQRAEQIRQFYATYERYNDLDHQTTQGYHAAKTEGRIPSWGHLGMGMGEIDAAKLKPPSEWDVNTQQAMREAQQSEEQYARASLRYYTALAEQAEAGQILMDRLNKEMQGAGIGGGSPELVVEYAQLADKSDQWAEQQIEALEEIQRAQATLARIGQEQAAEAERVATRTRNQDALAAGDFGTLTGGGSGADATIRVTATKAAADNYDRIALSMAEMAQHAQAISAAESKTAKAVAESQSHYAQLASLRRKEEAGARESWANAEKLLQIERTSTEEKKRATAEERKLAQAEKTRTATAQANVQANRAQAESARATAEIERRAAIEASAAAHERRRIADAEYQERTQRSRAAAQAEIEEQRRVTASLRTEANSRSRIGMMAGNLGRSLMYGAAGALGLYGVEGAARMAFQGGKQGAAHLETQQSFSALADRMEVDADRMIAAVKRASGSTISDMQAITYSVQILAQRFAASSDDIAADTATLIEYARRLGQMGFADASGQLMDIQEVMGRLIGYAREGNRELVDQFGLSNQVISDLLGVTKDGLAGASGSAIRWQGILEFARQEMERLGPAATNAASEIAGSEARITDSMNRLRAAAAEPIAFVVDLTADVVEGVIRPEDVQETLDTLQRTRQELEQYGDALYTWGTGIADVEGATGRLYEAASQLQDANRLYRQTTTSAIEGDKERQAAELQLAKTVERLGESYRDLIALGEAGIIDPGTVGRVEAAWSQIVADLQAGAISLDEAAARARELENNLRAAAGAVEFAIPQAADFAQEIANAADEADRLKINLGDAVYDMATIEGRLSYLQASQQRREQRAQANAISGNVPGREYETGGLNLAALAVTRQGAELLANQRKLQEEEAKLNQRTASEAGRAWQQAARETVQAFDSAIRQIPGLFGTSGVTQGDLDRAAAGLPVNFADNYIRRLEDEIVNGVDWAGVDVGDAARRLGMDPGMDPKIVLEELRHQWSSGQLFAGGQNLDLVDLDAVKAAYQAQEDAEAGQAELRRYIGQALGIDVETLDAQAQATLATDNNTAATDANTAALLAWTPGGAAAAEAEREAVAAMSRPGSAIRSAVEEAVVEAVAAAEGAAAPYLGGAVPEATGSLTPARRVGTPPASYVDTSGTMPTYQPFLGGALPIEGGRLAGGWAAQGLANADLPAIGPALPAVAGGMIAALIDSLMDSPSQPGLQDLVAGGVVYSPWAAGTGAAYNPALPAGDANGYGRPLIPGLDTPSPLTAQQMGGGTLTTPAPFTEITQGSPYGGLSDALLPGWLTGEGQGAEDVRIFLPLVTQAGSLEAMLGDQPAEIGQGLMERIGAAVEDAPLVQRIKAIWDRDIQENAAELQGVGTAIAVRINQQLEQELGSLSGGLVGVIVANVLEALAAEE